MSKKRKVTVGQVELIRAIESLVDLAEASSSHHKGEAYDDDDDNGTSDTEDNVEIFEAASRLVLKPDHETLVVESKALGSNQHGMTADHFDKHLAMLKELVPLRYGDIILQAESTQFRVNRDILAQQSSVFKDMFGVPLPADEPTVEGCPIVRVSDTAKDWEHLLELLYYHPFKATPSRPFAVVAAMLRLGKKYDIPEARDDALARLQYEFPTHLDAYTRAEYRGLTKIDPRKGIHVDLLNLCYDCSVYSCIPTVALQCFVFYNLGSIIYLL
ncbi:hypothetical protein MSAN_01571300 [Mycena sanguinolenta]|uniref:BTB domain-containing protein n=1 Tax=Mycena sanguinolenta TaxID=230812 RepID=A0A8H6Y3Q3_9AGAR|nr:hypothetical protein MSAN_01571300 [Mycena sanguinolenta]